MIREPVLYPRVYPFFIVLAAMDVLLTWVILTTEWHTHYGVIVGLELNGLANSLWHAFGSTGLVVLKFATVLFVLVACEVIGRRRAWTGRKIAEWAAAANAVPVIVGATQIATVAYAGP